MNSWNTTLCYIEREGQYLMLHRVKKKNDINQDKWIGIGGKFEEKESPEECLLREVKEETGLTLTDYRYRGLVTFVSDGGSRSTCTSSPPPPTRPTSSTVTKGSWSGWIRTR